MINLKLNAVVSVVAPLYVILHSKDKSVQHKTKLKELESSKPTFLMNCCTSQESDWQRNFSVPLNNFFRVTTLKPNNPIYKLLSYKRISGFRVICC